MSSTSRPRARRAQGAEGVPRTARPGSSRTPAGDGVGHSAGVAERGQVHHQTRGVAAPAALLGQAGLAHPARAGQRHQPVAARQRAHRGQLPLPADERGRRRSRSTTAAAAGGGDGLERPPQHLLLEPFQP